MDVEFKTEQQRREHPKACLIPGLLLSSLFNSRLSESELGLMDASLDSINAQLDAYSRLDATKKLHYWLCIILSHPSISETDYLRIGGALGLSSAQLFASAALIGRRDLLFRFLPLTFDELTGLLKADHFAAFRWAVVNGHTDVADWLAACLPATLIADMVEVRGYWPLRAAIEGGYISIVKNLFDLAPSKADAMLRCLGFAPFSWAAAGGHLSIMQELLLRASADDALKMREANDFGGFRWAAQLGNVSIINWLLLFPEVFFYADEHREKYRPLIRSFITERVATLRAIKLEKETTMPPVVFDLSDSDAKCAYYILRNLVRRNDPGLIDDIRFLTEIPAVRKLLHQEVIKGKPNLILQIANIYNNQGAAEILLAIPAVSRLAAHHGYYRTDPLGRLDLATLARGDMESSVRALSEAEQGQLAAALAHYNPLINAAGVDNLFEALKEDLIWRYTQHSATIQINGLDVVLPVSWSEFLDLNLTPEQCKEALKAYHQHKIHTALRYLSRPNPWMAEDAEYVYRVEAESWSTFEGYKERIVLGWIAAQDITVPPTYDYTITGRIDYFINQIALMGRAHNWDEQQPKKNAHGEPVLDEYGHPVLEEYDNIDEGDKPTCYSGANQYLAHCVIGHPLFIVLTEQVLKQEVRNFVRAHFESLITNENREILYNAWIAYCGSAELADAAPLRVLDITPVQQALFIQRMSEKYEAQFTNVQHFKTLVANYFKLVERESNPSDCMHALKLDGLANLHGLLQPPPPVSTSDSASGGGALASEVTSDTESSGNDGGAGEVRRPGLEISTNNLEGGLSSRGGGAGIGFFSDSPHRYETSEDGRGMRP